MTTLNTVGRRAPPSLPPEILEYILRINLKQNVQGAQSINEDPQDDNLLNLGFRRDAAFLVKCCGVSQDWYRVAAGLLYRSRIHLCTQRTLELLLRAVREDLATSYPIYHLALRAHTKPESWTYGNGLDALSAVLLPLCTELRYLECTSPNFAAPLKALAAPQLVSLRELSIGYMDFLDLTPALMHAPNLEKLDATSVTNRRGGLGSLGYISRARGTLLKRILRRGNHRDRLGHPPAPPFSLRHLRLCNTRLDPAQVTWLFANTQAVARVELEGNTGDILVSLADATGGAISSLQLTGRHPPKDLAVLAREISRLSGLKSLRLDHTDKALAQLLPAIKVPLECLEVYNSTPNSMPKLADALRNGACLPQLRRVTVYRSVFIPPSRLQKSLMEASCSGRGIECTWKTYLPCACAPTARDVACTLDPPTADELSNWQRRTRDSLRSRFSFKVLR